MVVAADTSSLPAVPVADPESPIPLPTGLTAAYLVGADPVDLAGLAPADPGEAAAAHAHFAAVRLPGSTLLRVRPAGPDDGEPTVVEIVTDDMPFLVDSITAALAGARATARVLLHPRPVVARDAAGRLIGIGDPAAPPDLAMGGRSVRESWIRVQTRSLDSAGREQLARTLERVLADVRATDEDTAQMRARALSLAAELDSEPPVGIDPVEVAEAAELLAWLADEYWTFIGYREYSYSTDPTAAGGPAGAAGELTIVEGSGLGVLRGGDPTPRALPPIAARRAAERSVLVITKTNQRSTVLRPAHLDYVGVKAFDEVGNVVGERRFLGLFPPEDRGGWVLDVPVARRRARQVLTAIGADADSHDGLGVLQVLGSLPRAELLAAGRSELTTLARGTLRLMGRRGVRVFARVEPYGRFLSFVVCLAGVEHGAGAISTVEAALAEATGGVVDPATLAVVGSGVVRLHTIVRPVPGSADQAVAAALVVPDLGAIEDALLRRLADWRADLSELLTGRLGERGEALAARWVPAFPAAYREDVTPADALADVFALDELTEPGSPGLAAALVPPGRPDDRRSDDGQTWRFTLYRRGPELSLSAVLPVLSGLGVEVTDERPYRIRSLRPGDEPAATDGLWVFTFRLHLPVQAGAGAAPTLPWRFSEAFLAAFGGVDDSDGLAALVVSGGLDRGAVAVLRLYLRWLRQTGWTFGDDYARGALLAHPAIAALLAELFMVRFDPDVSSDPDVSDDRDAAQDALRTRVLEQLDAVTSLDADRILRRVLTAIEATVRTNAFGRGPLAPSDAQSPLVIVLDPRAVPGLPHPVPWREIFVSSAAVEGVHLRFGPVARGGLRWSDRPEDFRTEVLGLAKAQTVKNTVIVPTGAKGGFVVRRPPAPTGDPGADREAFAAAGRACYELFIGGLLDVVDTLDTPDPGAGTGTRRVRHPERTVCHDGEDSYLVVAADKGTATFSDIANGIAVARGFWLGDAFASGGSAGFDHKRMGITAKGAWESVRRHFAELGLDADTAPITVVGIGDMSGDVFGNGMLLSSNLRLVAAFDHRHVFLDPDPDPARAFAERTRLFALPRSSWADYERSAISAGGGVFGRDAKSIAVPAAAARVLGIDAVGSGDVPVEMTPEELVRAILHAPVDLLFNGGIGTWVKASTESHAAAGDRANDPVRADAAALRVKVIAEGGNLGMTQRGRIEFTRSGGRCNTDFVDNSAGVDTSDREVNLKILLGQAITAGQLRVEDRDALLAAATDEVAVAVLSDNRSQNLASATEAAQALSLGRWHADLAGRLESAGLLERSVEAFPTDIEMTALRRAGAGLSVPELAVLSAWAKIWLTQEFTDAVAASADDPLLAEVVAAYLPASLRDRFGALAPAHPLALGIEATVLVNGVVDVAGPTFASRLSEELAVGVDQLVLAHTAARAILGTDSLLTELAGSGLDMALEVEVRIELRTLAERVTRWLIREHGLPVVVDPLVASYRDGIADVARVVPGLLTGRQRTEHDERLARWCAAGVPERVAAAAAVAPALFAGLTITDLTRSTGRPLSEVAAVHVAVGDALGLPELAEALVALPRADRWASRARAALRDDLTRAHTALTRAVLVANGGGEAVDLVRRWLDGDGGSRRNGRSRAVLAEAADPGDGPPDLTRLVVAVRAVVALAG